MLRAFEARIRVMRSTAGRPRVGPKLSDYPGWIKQDGIARTCWWILYRKFVTRGKGTPATALGVDPKREVLRALRGRRAA